MRQHSMEDSFICMLNACVLWPNKWDASEIIAYWWTIAFPTRPLTEEELNENTIDTIRTGLLCRGGVTNPVLTETTQTERIKKSIIFTEEI